MPHRKLFPAHSLHPNTPSKLILISLKNQNAPSKINSRQNAHPNAPSKRMPGFPTTLRNRFPPICPTQMHNQNCLRTEYPKCPIKNRFPPICPTQVPHRKLCPAQRSKIVSRYNAHPNAASKIMLDFPKSQNAPLNNLNLTPTTL